MDRNDHPNRVLTKDSLRGSWQKALGQSLGSNGITTGVPKGTICWRILFKDLFSFRTCGDANDCCCGETEFSDTIHKQNITAQTSRIGIWIMEISKMIMIQKWCVITILNR